MTRAEAYETLGLEVGALSESVLAAHRQLVREWHPDLYPLGVERDEAEEKLKHINAARDRLLEVWIDAPEIEDFPPEPEMQAPPTPAPPAPDPMEGIFVVAPNVEPMSFQGSGKFWIFLVALLSILVVVLISMPEESTPRRMDEGFFQPNLSSDVPTVFDRPRVLVPQGSR